ncbi:MAG: hypothetical protein K2X47_17195, partial [Bdellovibrionales bacterium]|nr:hypothetical protein [Bdellovibrionales bacterium]
GKVMDSDHQFALAAARKQFFRVDVYLQSQDILLPEQVAEYLPWFGSRLESLCPLESTHIVLMEAGFFIHIDNRSVVRFDPQSSMGKLFRMLAQGLHSSEKLFNDIYDLPFTPKRSGTLRAFLSRTRKMTGLKLKQDGDQIIVQEKILFQDRKIAL